MAQWNGQYTGNTHGTKVADFESVLKNAVKVFKASSEELRSSKASAVRKLAGKVLTARLKMIKAKINELAPVESAKQEERRVQIEHLQASEAKIASDGIDGVLREFGASELAGDSI